VCDEGCATFATHLSPGYWRHAGDLELTTPEFAGRVKVFAEFIDHHAKEEEKTMFKMAREMFSVDEREQLNVDYETWKASSGGKTVVARAMKEMGARMR